MDFQQRILFTAYNCWVNDLEKPSLEPLWSNEDEKKIIRKESDILHHKGLIQLGFGNTFEIDLRGVIEVEEKLPIDKLVLSKMKGDRIVVLKLLKEKFDLEGPIEGLASFYEILSAFGNDSDESRLWKAIWFLENSGYITENEIGYLITRSGADFLGEYSLHFETIRKFNEISELEPHKRGQKFNSFVANIAELSGWRQESGTRSSNEEIDVIISKNREYFLIECKWEKKPIEASVVRELYGKLASRTGVNGIIVSMSNFSSGCSEEVLKHLTNKIIILFGNKDIQSIVTSNANFETLLNSKYHALITNRTVIYE